MPKPVGAGQRYLPGLDGLRAIAVLAVIAYHEQFGWASGGLLGVGVFFTLSGFLITGLLIEQWAVASKIKLGDFWLRRARRLLPALFVMLAVVTAWVTIADRARLASLRGAVGAAAGYFSNWYLIARNQSYFARFAPPAPLDHLWSLAVEEQFYLLWPLLLFGGLFLLHRLGKSAPRWLIIPTALLTVVSAYALIRFYQPGFDPTRVYEGTDTRAFGLLIGAVLALAWPVRIASKPAKSGRILADVLGFAGLLTIGVMIWRVGEYSAFSYRGGMVLLSVATAGVVAATAIPGTAVGLALGWRPLRWIGARSYGIYLWHFPVIVLTTPVNARPGLLRVAIQVAAVVIIAALSWKFVEEPIRHGALNRLWVKLRTAGSAARTGAAGGLPTMTTFSGLAATAGITGLLIVAGVGLSGALHGPAGGGADAGSEISSGSLNPPVTKSIAHPKSIAHGAASPAPTVGGPLRTSCRAVAHIGDSTSDGLVERKYLPVREQIAAQYEDVGAQSVITDVQGARSVMETLPGTVNGFDAAKSIRKRGFAGCWVLALGTDDTADVSAGSTYSLAFRIKKMMSVAHGEPVMWVNVVSLLNSGPYAETAMAKWDEALVRACRQYPNMAVYNWAKVARKKWFISDGIHYTSLGYKHRSKDIARALARAFPAAGQSKGCVVSG